MIRIHDGQTRHVKLSEQKDLLVLSFSQHPRHLFLI